MKKIFVISTGMGSTEVVLKEKHSATVAYAISKAAVNMLVAKFSLTYKEIFFLAVCPGFVMTMQGRECFFKSFKWLSTHVFFA